MGFLVDSGKNYICSNEVKEAGKELFINGSVSDIHVASFWKTEIAVNGVVETMEKRIHPKFTIVDDGISGYGCSCEDFSKTKKVCKHIIALAYKYENYKENKEPAVVYTSQAARDIVNLYMDKTNDDSRNIMSFSGKISVNVNAAFDIYKEQSVLKVSFEFKYGNNKYIIRDLGEFADRFNNNEYYRYGKYVAFVHNYGVFDEKSQELMKFVVYMVNYEKQHIKLSGSARGNIINGRELLLIGYAVDHFVDILNVNNIPVFVDGKLMYIKKEKLPISVSVDRKGTGYRVKLRGIKNIISGAKNLYVVTDNDIYQCLETFARDMKDFLVNICSFRSGYALEISEKDMPQFYNMVMRAVEKHAVVDYNHIDTKEFEPWELNVKFVADIDHSDKLTVKVYGDYDGVPFDITRGRISKVYVNRDYYKEYTIKNILGRFFEQEEDCYITNDYEKIYEFIRSGVRELEALGSVEIMPGLKNFNLEPKLSVGTYVRFVDNMISLDINTEGYTRAELEEVLKAYKAKAGFVRFKNKGLLKLDDSELFTLSEFLDDLGYDLTSIYDGNIFVPKYRGVYIDRSLKHRTGFRYEKDDAFKKLVSEIKTAGETEYPVPTVLKGVLRQYQEVGFSWLESLDKCGFGGILADDMGLGKTIQIIALLESHREEGKTSLIVCPSSLIYNWENEIKKFAPMITVTSVVGGKSERRDIISEYEKYDVLVTSYELLKRDVELYKDIMFRFHVIDEAQYIKNPVTGNAGTVKKIRSETRFALTGTPIENRLSELWSIFDFILPGCLFSYSKFKKNFETPIIAGDTLVSDRLKEMVKPFILRRMKNDVLKDLPDKQEYQLYAKMEGEQNKLYLANALKLRREIEVSDTYEFNNNKIQVLAELTRLRQICCDPSLCYEEYDDESVKLQMCIDLVKNGIEGGHKILLFSQFVSMLEIIKKRLEEEGIKYYILTGTTKKESRAHMVENFNTDDTPVFLISLKAGGTGLNLTGADMVIHYDPWWNKAAELQATDRAHRIGQKNVVSVYKLIAKDTIEEYIVELQNRKQKLSTDIIETDGVGLSSLTKDDILRLLS